jgi:hypothetical protein
MSAKACGVPTAVSAAAMSAKACAVSAATVSTAAMSAATVSTATVSAATAAGVCFECEKRHDEEQHRGHASASRQYRPHGDEGVGAPRRG